MEIKFIYNYNENSVFSQASITDIKRIYTSQLESYEKLQTKKKNSI